MRLSDAAALRRFDGRAGASKAVVIVLVGLLLFAIALLNWVVGPEAPFSHLFYLPILLAGVRLGWRPAMGVAVVSVVLFHVLDPKLASFQYAEADVIQLVLFVVVAIVSARLATQSRELHKLATTDDLTGLHNLRSFEARVHRDLESAAKGGTNVAMVALDVDRLKKLNDVHGHLTGADAVRHVGQTIATLVPAQGVACRYGGDEFVIFLPRCDERAASAFAELLCRAVRESAPTLAGKQFESGAVTVSVGVATGSASRGVPPTERAEALFRDADLAMYDAKAAGRGVVVVRRAEAAPLSQTPPIGPAAA